MPKFITYFLYTALGALVIMQFFAPKSNSAGYQSVVFFEEQTKPSQEIATILRDNCYDCHSNQTNYPWYSEITPVNYWLEEHIVDGKKHFNVSDWDAYSARKKDHKLEELVEFVESGEMPLDSYTWIHGDLSQKDAKLLIQWVEILRLGYQKEIAGLLK